MKPKYICLDPRYQLRGWSDLPHALLDSEQPQVIPLSSGVFRTLQLCNGRFRSTDPVFWGVREKLLEALKRQGILTFSDEPCCLQPGQEYRFYPNHFLGQIHWSVTGRCNYRCRHCFMSAPHAVLPQPSTEEVFRIADQIADCGVPIVSISGGEPLVRDDFLRLLKRLTEHGIKIDRIMSNGALVTEEFLDALEALGIRCGLDMSFDGTDGWHYWMRGIDGAGEAVLRAFTLCRERGFPTGAQFTLHRGNIGVLRESARLLGKLGIRYLKVGPLQALGEGRDLEADVLSYDEIFDAYAAYLPQFVEDGMPLPNLTLGGIFKFNNGAFSISPEHFDGNVEPSNRLSCRVMHHVLYLGPDGYVLPCITMSYRDDVKEQFPNISSMTLSEVLSDSFCWDCAMTTVGSVLEHNPKCRACDYRDKCGGGCRAAAAIMGEGFLGVAPESCRFFLGGYYDRARKLIDSLQPLLAAR